MFNFMKSLPHLSVESHVTLNLPIPPVTPSSFVTYVPSTLPIWVPKTLESTSSEVRNPSDTRQTRSNFSLMTKVLATDDPTTYVQAKGKLHWEHAMFAKYESILRNKTWSLVPLPLRKNLVGCKWVYTTKFTAEGQIKKHKARLVTKGFNKLEGIDYNETFAPIAKMNTIRTILSLVASYKWEIHQMDIKNAFLNGDLTKEMYMQQPLGFIYVECSSLVCKVQKFIWSQTSI